MGYYFGRTSVDQVVSATLATLIESGYVKTRENANGDLDLVKLTFEERLDDTVAESKDC
jgi:hypothetical protein